jgi:hypothetical protein
MQTKQWISLLMLFVLLGVLPSYCDQLMAENKKKFYEIEFLDKNYIKLTSHIHLIPPGSQLLHENVRLKDIGDLPIKADLKADLKKDAMLSIDFFEKKLKEEVGKSSHLKFEKALFNVYMDFMGNHTTDMIYMTYKIRRE